jgi:hypothetical protein
MNRTVFVKTGLKFTKKLFNSAQSETISATLSKVITVPNVFGKIVEHPSSLALKVPETRGTTKQREDEERRGLEGSYSSSFRYEGQSLE